MRSLDLSAEMRQLIEAIEAWPSVVNSPAARPLQAARRPPPRPAASYPSGTPQSLLRLSSSMKAPESHALSSIASCAAQRPDPTQHSVLGPHVGPGTYALKGMAAHGPLRLSVPFSFTAERRSRNAAGSAAAEMYGRHSGEAPTSSVNIVSPFASTTARFDDAEYARALRLRQVRLSPPTTISPRNSHPALPNWDGLETPPGHHERLQAARASQQNL
jgi:hypothetical protein